MELLVVAALAECYRRSGQLELEVDTYRQCLAHQPERVFPREELAAVCLVLGLEAEAKEACELLHGRSHAALYLAELECRRMLRVAATDRDWEKVESAVARALTSPSDAVLVGLLEADVEQLRGHFSRSQRLLAKLADAYPADARVFFARVRLALRRNELAHAEELLADAEISLTGSELLAPIRRFVQDYAADRPDSSPPSRVQPRPIEDGTPSERIFHLAEMPAERSRGASDELARAFLRVLQDLRST
jgi:hypothetical protein